MNLKQFAKKHKTGGVTWYLTPYTTLRNQAVSDQFNAVVPIAERKVIEQSFVAIESYAIEIEFANKLTPEEQRFAAYWNDRPLKIADKWEAFSFLADASIINAFWDAFSATRDTVIEDVTPVSAEDLPNS